MRSSCTRLIAIPRWPVARSPARPGGTGMKRRATASAAQSTEQQPQCSVKKVQCMPTATQQTLPERQEHLSWRLELFVKSHAELRSQLPFLRQHGLLRLNITNKSDEDDLLATLAELTAGLLPQPGGMATAQGPQQQQGRSQSKTQQEQQQQQQLSGTHSLYSSATALDVCLHYSLKYNYEKTPERSLARLLNFCQALHEQQMCRRQSQDKPSSSNPAQSSRTSSGSTQPAADSLRAAAVHVLLVSGGGKKKRFDTIAALQALQKHYQQQQQQQEPGSALVLPSMAVAFNPYLPDEAAAAEERRRLRAKLQTGLVGKVYLQMGTDLQRLESALSHIQQLCQQLSDQRPEFNPPQLLGSVFLPSRRLLAQMKFRPWNGVFLSEQYLSSVEAAEAITRELLVVYRAAGVVPLLESAVKTPEELSRAKQLLGML